MAFLTLLRLTELLLKVTFDSEKALVFVYMGSLASIFRRLLLCGWLCGAITFAQTAPIDEAAALPAPASPVATVASGVPDPSWAIRRSVFLKRLVSTQALVETFPGAGFDEARNFPKQWGRGADGFGKRVASQYGQFAVGEAIEFGISAFHREDPRYFRMPEASIGKRIRHSLISGVWVRSADGTHHTVALARLANVYGSWAIATSWNPPEQRSFTKIITYGSLGLGIKTSTNLFREFWPDIKTRVFHR